MKSLKVGVLALSTVLLLGACGTSKVKPEDTRKVLEKNGYVVVIKNAEEFNRQVSHSKISKDLNIT